MSAPTRPRRSSGGTQSPPLQDSEPMGVSSIRGDRPHGVPDRVQRAQYFDEPEPSPKVNEDSSSESKVKPGTNLWETSATADEPMRKLNAEQSATHELKQQGSNNVRDTIQKQPAQKQPAQKQSAARPARSDFDTK